MITNAESRTNIQEIAAGIYRVNTPVPIPGTSAQFSFNQYLIADDEPLLFHTGPRGLYPFVSEAIGTVMPVQALRHIALSHFEADDCGALNSFLAACPRAVPLCGRVAAMTSVSDFADRPPRALVDSEEISLGRHKVRWYDAPHVPHAWDCGLMFESASRTLFCGDLFTQGGSGELPLTESDILGPSEEFRKSMDYFAHAPQTTAVLARLARDEPATLACMHGSAWRGNGAALLGSLAAVLT